MNLRELAESDLSDTLEGDWSQPVTLTGPDGVLIDKDISGNTLTGQVIYEQIKIDPGTGGEVIVNEPVITLRSSSLSRVPRAGEKWLISFPISPVAGSAMVSHVLSSDHAPDGGASLGIIRLYPQKVKQS